MQPVVLDTVAKLLAAGYELGIECPGCQRWGVLDMRAIVERGQGDRKPSSFRPRCSVCGGLGKWQVRPPTSPQRPINSGEPR